MQKTIAPSIGLLILRLALGLILTAHGWQKLNEFTIAGTQATFTQIGVPSPDLAAPIATYLEIIGGVGLMLGLLTRIFAVLLALDMFGALILVHASSGIFVTNGGYELVLILAASAATLAFTGSGKISLDTIFTAHRRKSRTLSRS